MWDVDYKVLTYCTGAEGFLLVTERRRVAVEGSVPTDIGDLRTRGGRALALGTHQTPPTPTPSPTPPQVPIPRAEPGEFEP